MLLGYEWRSGSMGTALEGIKQTLAQEDDTAPAVLLFKEIWEEIKNENK